MDRLNINVTEDNYIAPKWRGCKCPTEEKKIYYVWSDNCFWHMVHKDSATSTSRLDGTSEQWILCDVCAAKLDGNMKELNTQTIHSLTGGE